MGDRPRVRALLMDADGVTQYPHAGWLTEMARLGGPRFVADAFRHEKTTLTGQADLRELLTALLERDGRDCTADDILQVWYRVELDERMLDLVDRVRAAGVTTALATNQQSYRGGFMLANLPYDEHFDHQFHSFQVGLAKPDPAFFTHIVETLGIAPSEAVFVDDMAVNVRGARRAGLQAVHFAGTDTYGHLRSRLRALGVPGV
ncbi:HAD family hydrolase [Propionicimonas sp. T2.31MG-18]|uniref:HAD family hydrolase n=1 Tax=Propionicimonas sp. T2.31MG-18 TaxID=3157620 RepID=UPI0036722B07